MNKLLPELNREFVGLSDSVGLQLDIDNMRHQLTAATNQLAVERELAAGVHRARSIAISQSEALRLVFGVDDIDDTQGKDDTGIDDVLSSAFVRKVSNGQLPAGFGEIVSKRLRTTNHPDVGGDSMVARDIGHSLSELVRDPTFSIAKAMLVAPRQERLDSRDQRIERYHLHLALKGASPQFTSKEEATCHAEREIEGAEWRVRADAASKTLQLIVGDDNTWSRFLQSIVNSQYMTLINMVNRLQPAILSVQERLIKGDPVATNLLNIEEIDDIFGRIWSALNNKSSPISYSPPYQNWLEILLPAMKLLDPGQKPGEKYTLFKPPIEIRHAPFYASGYGGHGGDKDEKYYGNKIYENDSKYNSNN